MSEVAIVLQTTVLSSRCLVSLTAPDSGLRPGSGGTVKLGAQAILVQWEEAQHGS